MAGFEDSADTLCNTVGRNLIQITVKEPRIILPRLFGQRFYPGA